MCPARSYWKRSWCWLTTRHKRKERWCSRKTTSFKSSRSTPTVSTCTYHREVHHRRIHTIEKYTKGGTCVSLKTTQTFSCLTAYLFPKSTRQPSNRYHISQFMLTSSAGWWFLSTEYGDGWGPATHLQSLDPSDTDEPDPIYQGRWRRDVTQTRTAIIP